MAIPAPFFKRTYNAMNHDKKKVFHVRPSCLSRILACIVAAELLCLQVPLNAVALESAEPAETAGVSEVFETTDDEGAAAVSEAVDGDSVPIAENDSIPADTPDETDTQGANESSEAIGEETGTEEAPDNSAESESTGDLGIEASTSEAETAVPNGSSASGETANGQVRRVEVNSGAQRSADFISVDDAFVTPDGTFNLVMGGLKEGNRKAVLEALEKYYAVGSQAPLALVDEAFPDAEKYDNQPEVNRLTGEGFFDSMHCWAASTSNILWVSGWAPRIVNPNTGKPFSSEDDVFEYFNSSFSDAGSEAKSGIDWFFMGEYFLISYGGDAHLLKPKNPDDGLKKDFVSARAQENIILAEPSSGRPELIEELLRVGPSATRPAMFEASIGSLNMGVIKASSHSVTAAGLIVDPYATKLADRFKAIALIDSDNDADPSAAMGKGSDTYGYGPSVEVKNKDKEARPNSVTFYGLELIEDKEGTPCWKLLGYSMDADGYEGTDPTILYKMTALPIYDEQLLTRYSENAEGGGTASAADNVDLVIETAFTTDETEPITNLYGFVAREHTVTEFAQGEPITLNYLVQNRSDVALTEEYAGKDSFTVDWKVVRESDGAVVAHGQSVCGLPEHWHSQVDYVTALNVDGGEVATWEPGAYTAVLEVNADRSIVEAYYLNNVPIAVPFVITPSGDPEPEPEDNPDEESDIPEDPDTDDEGTPGTDDGDESSPEQAVAPDGVPSSSGACYGRGTVPAPSEASAKLPQTGDENALCLQMAAGMTAVAIVLIVASLAERARG